MITPTQATSIMQEAAQQFTGKYGSGPLCNASLLQFLVTARIIMDRALGGKDGLMASSSDQEKGLQEAAGVLLLALQHHGTALYTTYRLKRSLHPQQAAEHSAALEQQFLAHEAKDIFETCFRDAKEMEQFVPEDWDKLRAILQRTGVSV